jgi:hypothetical protein
LTYSIAIAPGPQIFVQQNAYETASGAKIKLIEEGSNNYTDGIKFNPRNLSPL